MVWFSLFGKKRLKEKIKLKGIIVLTVRDKNGKIRDIRVIENTITNAGKTRVAQLMCGVSTTPFRYIGIGSGTASDSGLGSPIAYQQADVNAPTTYARWTTTFTMSSNATVTEAVLCDSSTGGTVLSYQNFTGISMVAGEQLTIEWTITVS
jgi:hypothetical protein